MDAASGLGIGLVSKITEFFLDEDTVKRRRAADNELRDIRRRGHEKESGGVNVDDEDDTTGSIAEVIGDTARTTANKNWNEGKSKAQEVRMSDSIFEDVEMFSSMAHSNVTESSEGTEKDDNGKKERSACFECVYDSLCRGHTGLAIRAPATRGTKALLSDLIRHPRRDLITLQTRRDELLRLARVRTQQPDLWERYVAASEQMSRLEVDVMWAFHGSDETSKALYEIAYFSPWLVGVLDRVPVALTTLNIYKIAALPIMGALTPLVCFVVPYLILRWKIGLPISFKTYLWIMYRSLIASNLFGGGGGSSWTRHASIAMTLLFYFQSVFTSLEVSRALRIVCGCIDTRMRRVARFFRHAAWTVDNFWPCHDDDDVVDDPSKNARPNAGRTARPSPFFDDVQRPSAPELAFAMDDAHGKEAPSLMLRMTQFGTSLSRYKYFDRDLHRRLAVAFYAVDCVLRISGLCAADTQSTPSGFSAVEWIPHRLEPESKTSPDDAKGHIDGINSRIDLEGLWHPCLRPDLAVDNDLTLCDRSLPSPAGAALPPNLIMTGPNAGGKSMFIKASVIAVLLAHSLGIAPCRGHARMRPFCYISSQINVPDVKGARSLFEEEMHRAKRNLDVLRDISREEREAQTETLDDDRHGLRRPERLAFIVVDEIFSSTNPVEGISGAYSVALNIARNPHATSIISTHYTYLCRLKSIRLANPPLFSAVQMPVDMTTEPPQYPYTVVPGVCRQYIALDLLKRNDFDDAVLRDAFDVKRCILAGPMDDEYKGRGRGRARARGEQDRKKPTPPKSSTPHHEVQDAQ